MSDVEKENTEQENATTKDLVVVGSSAGGIEALSILVSTLPKNFPAPIVLAQHLDPNRQSSLDLILQRRTALPIYVVHSRMPLEDGKIYVIPSNRHVTIRDHTVEVQADSTRRPHPSVDLLLTTAAEAYGEHLIAVILTGTGTDGASGAVDVKNHGGTVIVQDPRTARYPAMPLSLPPTAVDFEASLEQISGLLYDLLTGAMPPQGEERTEDVLHEIFEQVNRQANIDFRPYKMSTILRRIGRRMAISHNHTIRDYANYLRSYPEEVGELVKAFLINVTQFFRDTEAFTYLHREILPRLITKARERDKVLRFWTAGCATGEEPYSLAMILTDILGAELPEWSIKIFATDLDEAAIIFARRGLYSENMLKGVPTEYRERFFEHIDATYRISKTLRQMVIFGQQDLSRSAPFPRIDLVLCRNVLIYFTPELQDYVLNQFAFSLSSNGYLFLGKAETVRPSQSYYELVNKQWKMYRCTGNVLHTARQPRLSELSTLQVEGRIMNRPNAGSGKHSTEQEIQSPPFELGQLRRFNELLLRFLPIGVIVIDRSYRIMTANGSARRLLGLRETGTEQDFLHSVRGIPYPTVRIAIDTIFREHSTVMLPEVELATSNGGNGRFVSLSLALMQYEANSSNFVIISVADVTEQVQTRRQLETTQAEQSQLMSELGMTNKRLSDVNKEMLDANEELQVTNEELVLTHEELQASIEEFETTNEELQATNEELETNNEELQATNEELETTNDELRSRTNELQETAAVLESERMRLAEIVELAPLYVLLLHGPHLTVEVYHPRYAQMIEGRVVLGKPFEEVHEIFWDAEAGMQILQLARRCYQLGSEIVSPRLLTSVPGIDGTPTPTYFIYTLTPTHDMHGKIDGVVIYAIDELRQQTHDEELERDRLKLIFEHADAFIMALYNVQTAQFITGSARYIEMVGSIYSPGMPQLQEHTWHEITFIRPLEYAAHIWKTVLEMHQPLRLPEVHIPTSQPEQERIWDYSLIPIMDTVQPNTIRFMLVSAMEITGQVRARQELERLDKLKDDFLSLATHELRTPLTAIQGNAEVMLYALRRKIAQIKDEEQEEQGTQQSQTMLERIVQQVGRMSRLIDEMLDVTRIRGKVFELQMREGVDMIALVQRVIEQVPHNSHEVVLEVAGEAIIGNWDEGRIEQVLNNLVSNAIKYSPKNMQVIVTVECAANDADEVIVSVKDAGLGISKEEQQHIFDRFYRAQNTYGTKIDGLGLGLYIAHEIITQHGGRIWLESEPKAGSTFYFSLPLNKKA